MENWIYPLPPETVLNSVFCTFVPMEGLDTSKRTLREGRSVRFKPNDSDYAVKHVDGNFRKLNVKALQHILTHRSDAEKFMKFVCISVNNTNAEKFDCLEYMLAITYAIYKAPQIYLIDTWSNRYDTPTPSHVASASKIAEGFLDVIKVLLYRENSFQNEFEATDLADFIIENGFLYGKRDEMCPASRSQIIRYLECLLINNENMPNIDSVNENKIDKIVKFSKIAWEAEALASCYSLFRLNHIKEQGHSLRFEDHAVITFPGSIDVFNFALDHSAIAKNPMVPYIQYTPMKNCKKYDQNIDIIRSTERISNFSFEEIRSSIKNAMYHLNSDYKDLFGFPPDDNTDDFDELFFAVLD